MCSVNKYPLTLTVHHPEGSKTAWMSGGFPHSEIPGSKGALASPGLIAECHVLHRLLPPRHPPNALIALDPSRKTTGEPLGRGTRAFQDQLGSFISQRPSDRLAPDADDHGQHSRLGKIKILIPSGLCKPNDHFRIDLVSLHDVNEPRGSEDRP